MNRAEFESDWRNTGQESYLSARSFTWSRFRAPKPSWDHEHCEFCGAKFSEDPNDLQLGYRTVERNDQRWVCEPCFADFSEVLRFRKSGPRD